MHFKRKVSVSINLTLRLHVFFCRFVFVTLETFSIRSMKKSLKNRKIKGFNDCVRAYTALKVNDSV